MRGAGSKPAKLLRKEIGDQRGSNGRPLCTWCTGEVPKGRRTWCSEHCVHAYRLRNDWTYLRAAVFKRDRGICAFCSTDTRVQERELKLARKRRGKQAALELAASWRIPGSRLRGDLWDADHIVPCVEGGENHPDNLRTLCIPCHAMQTDLLRKKRESLAAIARSAGK
jgi:5-methylcytosine-specific restriction enzyme A